MKRLVTVILSVLLVLLICFSIPACSIYEDKNPNEPNNSDAGTPDDGGNGGNDDDTHDPFLETFKNEISTLSSLTMLRMRNDLHHDGALYSMEVSGDFYFDDFIKQGGAKSDAELFSFISEKATRGLSDLNIKPRDIGCSSFTAVTKNGDRLFARNYDLSSTNMCLTLTNPKGKRHSSFSSVDLYFVDIDSDVDVLESENKAKCLAAPYAPVDGVNDAGLSCAVYMSYQGNIPGKNAVPTNQNDPDKPDITSSAMLRLILDYAANVDEAIELVKQYNLHDSANTSFHYMVVDASGKSAILEWVPEDGTDYTDNDGTNRKLVVTYNTGDEHIGTAEGASDFQWVTNFIIQPNYYRFDSEKIGLDRYNQIYSTLSATNGVVKDEWAAMELLKKVGVGTRNLGTCTVHSVVYNLTKKTVLFVSNENFNDPTAIYEYSFETGKIVRGSVK